ncbi:glycosyltransferase family 4 protein [Acidicapsa dinghuensis]|uniref:Glycosyltransferase family 4 protein n=1 Tax=Acidicapsa dinghuensis TaxID=2218256 RepID=A0ABW1EF60_9BACT|nr:glycosyltransferase family 4 protein [Acidicapsa dinghuensis]
MAVAKLFVDLANTAIPGKKQAEVVLVANERTRKALPPGLRGKVIDLVENGIDAEMWRSTDSYGDNKSRRFVFLGRLVDWKRIDIVIRALAQVPSAELEIIGDGPMSGPCSALARELGVQERVFFAGWVPQQECPARLQSALALVLPSIYECGGAVVLEAMAMGKPVIASRWGGPADYLNETCGILINPDSEAAMVKGFAEAMERLIDSPGLARAMGNAGRQRALRDFDWRTKIDFVLEIYRSLVPEENVTIEAQEEEASAVAVSEHS